MAWVAVIGFVLQKPLLVLQWTAATNWGFTRRCRSGRSWRWGLPQSKTVSRMVFCCCAALKWSVVNLFAPKLISSHGMCVNLYNNQGRTMSGGRRVIVCNQYGRQFNLDNLSKSWLHNRCLLKFAITMCISISPLQICFSQNRRLAFNVLCAQSPFQGCFGVYVHHRVHTRRWRRVRYPRASEKQHGVLGRMLLPSICIG